jgi:hypothetical protein
MEKKPFSKQTLLQAKKKRSAGKKRFPKKIPTKNYKEKTNPFLKKGKHPKPKRF